MQSNIQHALQKVGDVSVSDKAGYGPLARYVKLRVTHAPGMPGTFSPPPRFSDPDMHHGTCVTHVPWCMPGSLTSGFLWSQWRGKRSRHSRRMRNPQFYISGKRPMACISRVIQRKWPRYIENALCIKQAAGQWTPTPTTTRHKDVWNKLLNCL